MSNCHVLLQIPVVFSCWPETSMDFSWLCILLIPLLITFFSLFELICFLFAPSLSSAASSEELFLLSARDTLFKDLSSLAGVDFLQPYPFLFLKDLVSLYLLIVVWTPFHEHSIFLAISTWEYPSPDKATICALLISECCFLGGIFN